LLMLVFSTVVGAQSTILSRYVEEGIDNNLGLLKETLALEQKQSAVRQARGLYLPDVTFHANYTWADGGRSIDFPVGDLFNPIYSTLNGLTGSANFPTNLENQEIQLLPDDFHETKLQIIQPIFNSDIYFNYRAQRDLVDVQAAQREAFISELTKEIKSGYFQYLQSEAVLKIFDQTMVVLKELRRVNTRLVEAQKATKDVISTSDFEISELEQKIAVAQKNRNLAKAYFNFLLNRELE
ncbi:MAG: TolC family protein, partial [Calditrichaeota bacterium]|nr:TolC family protein [Calditrichota bacterium]